MQGSVSPRQISRRALLTGVAGIGVAGAVALQLGLDTSSFRQSTPGVKRPARLGVLWSGGDYAPIFTEKELGPELARLGHRVERDYVWEIRNADGDARRIPELAADLVSLPCDVITAAGGSTAVALQRATDTIPLVVAPPDALGGGLVTSLARPGGNLTGFTFGGRPQTRAKLKLLKDVAPGLERVAILVSSNEPSSGSAMQYADALADELGLKVRVIDSRSLAAVETALEEARAWPAEALVTVPATFLGASGVGGRISDFALQQRLPLAVTDGANLLLQPLLNYTDGNPGERAKVLARQIDRILRGARPGDLPMQQGTVVTITVNLQTAQTLGLTIPPIVLARATTIIQ